jgi:hypothetical protein
LPQLEAVQTSPRRLTGQTFLVLSMASCVTGVKGDRHQKSVDLANLTCLASLVLVSFSPEVTDGPFCSAASLRMASHQVSDLSR